MLMSATLGDSMSRNLSYSALLQSPGDLQSFSDQFSTVGGVRAELAYLEQTQVRGFFNSEGQLVGGFSLNLIPPFRYLDRIPNVPAPALSRCAEVGFAWFAPELDQRERFFIYASVIRDFVRSGRRYMVAGSVVGQLVSAQRWALPYSIYDGPVEVAGDTVQLSVYYGTLATIVRGYVGHLFTRKPRQLLRRVRAAFTSGNQVGVAV